MAKDGTNRGGRRVRAGDKPMSAAEKIQKGQTVRVMENNLPVLTPTELDAVDLPEGAVIEGADMPKPSDYLSARQKNGVPLGAEPVRPAGRRAVFHGGRCFGGAVSGKTFVYGAGKVCYNKRTRLRDRK